MEMHDQESGTDWLAFGGYTLLGYLALGIHRWVFAPGLAESGSAAQVVLVMVNLLAGSWCFLRALRAAWAATQRVG